MQLLVNNLLWTEGLGIVTVVLLLAAAGFFIWRPFYYVAFVLLFVGLYFFRAPERICVEALRDSSVIVCPADGKVVDISYNVHSEYSSELPVKVSIFLSPFDVHVNRSPIIGTISRIHYKPGSFIPAFLPKSSLLNERNDIVIRGEQNTIVVRQIAGTIARQICCWVQPMQPVIAGEEMGMIRFGSRVDLFMPQEVELEISVGQTVFAGQTVLGRCCHETRITGNNA